MIGPSAGDLVGALPTSGLPNVLPPGYSVLPPGWNRIVLGEMRLLTTAEFPGKVWMQHPDGTAGHFDAEELGDLVRAYFEEEF